MQAKHKFFFSALAIAFALDAGSKQLVIDNIARYELVPVIDGFFYFTHVRNPGAAFSMLANAPD